MEVIQTLNTLVPTCKPVLNADFPPALILPQPAAQSDLPDRSTIIPNHTLPTPPASTPVSTEPQRHNLRTHRPNVIFQYSKLVQNNKPCNPQKSFVEAIINKATREQLEYLQLIQCNKYKKIWEMALASELDRLLQGIQNLPGINIINFIPKNMLLHQVEFKLMGRLFLTVDHRKQNNTTLASHWAVTIFMIPEKSAPLLWTSPSPSSSLIPPSQPHMPDSSSLTSKISI